MEKEDRERLARTLDLSEENNRMLKKLLRAMRWGRIIRTIYWVVLIGISIGAFYYFQPLIDQFVALYGGFANTISDVNSFLSPGQ